MKNQAEVVSMVVARSVEWTDERVELLKRSCVAQGCSDDEFALFLEQCKHTGLNPFLKQAFLVERSTNIEGRWVKRFEFLAAEVGMAARANGFPDFRGIRGAAVYEKDVFEIDGSTGEVMHKFQPNKDRGRLVGAWAHVSREGRFLPVTYLTLASRIQGTREGKPNRFWAVMPEGQIAKCARAEQYRLAYPHIFSGVTIPEEMTEEEQPELSSPPPSNGANRTQSVTEHLTRVLEPKAKGLPAETPQVLLESFGLKGKAVQELPQERLELVTKSAGDWLADGRNKKGRAALERDLGRFTAELARRAASPAQTPAEGPHVEPDGEPPPPSDSDAPFSSE